MLSLRKKLNSPCDETSENSRCEVRSVHCIKDEIRKAKHFTKNIEHTFQGFAQMKIKMRNGRLERSSSASLEKWIIIIKKNDEGYRTHQIMVSPFQSGYIRQLIIHLRIFSNCIQCKQTSNEMYLCAFGVVITLNPKNFIYFTSMSFNLVWRFSALVHTHTQCYDHQIVIVCRKWCEHHFDDEHNDDDDDSGSVICNNISNFLC